MKNQFELVSEYKPSGDQPEAIRELVSGLKEDKKFQVLLGATGTGKTFTISNVIAQVNRPTLVFAHNKTLAGQLYSEFKEFFPHNRVEYFVSYFDYYQPEAYLPKTDTYIDKNTKTNEELDMLRMAAVNSVLERRDTIIVASVASIYGARASGGVILIQTKKGQAGKTNIEYNGSVSINTVLNKPTLMNAEQYGRAAFQAQAYDERVYGTSISLPSAYNYTWHRGDNGIAVLD